MFARTLILGCVKILDLNNFNRRLSFVADEVLIMNTENVLNNAFKDEKTEKTPQLKNLIMKALIHAMSGKARHELVDDFEDKDFKQLKESSEFSHYLNTYYYFINYIQDNGNHRSILEKNFQDLTDYQVLPVIENIVNATAVYLPCSDQLNVPVWKFEAEAEFNFDDSMDNAMTASQFNAFQDRFAYVGDRINVFAGVHPFQAKRTLLSDVNYVVKDKSDYVVYRLNSSGTVQKEISIILGISSPFATDIATLTTKDFKPSDKEAFVWLSNKIAQIQPTKKETAQSSTDKN